MIKDIAVGLWLGIGTLCIVLTGVGVVHDLSDGKIDGMTYVNGCPAERP